MSKCLLTRALFKDLGLDPNTVFGEFKPCARYTPQIDTFIYLEKDCTYVARPVSEKSNISILYDNNNEVVGVKIGSFSQVI
jgi:hypothetical protein